MEFRQRHLTAGITTIEVLIVIAVIGLLSTFSITGYLRAQTRASLRTQTDTLATAIRQAQSNAQTAVQGRAWGVACTGSTWTRFSIDGGSTDPEIQQQFRGDVRCAGTYDVRFAKLTGTISNDVTFDLTDGDVTSHITVTKVGKISVL